MGISKKHFLHPAFVLTGLLTLNACIYNDVQGVETLRSTMIRQNQNTAFENALAEEYKKLALYEADEMHDWPDAGTFAKKSLAANEGYKPVPEQLTNWDLEFGEERLSDARMRLTALMARGADDKAPQLAAKAQANFDCWVEQVEEGWQFDHIELCQSQFQQATLQLEKQLGEPKTVTFALNDSRLDTSKTNLLVEIAKEANRLDAPLASIVGYTDRSGSKSYNMALSLARADEVAATLIDAGYPRDRIAISAYGEDRLAVLTNDGISNPTNRRVEILFYPN